VNIVEKTKHDPEFMVQELKKYISAMKTAGHT
jgi:hypothetical protein